MVKLEIYAGPGDSSQDPASVFRGRRPLASRTYPAGYALGTAEAMKVLFPQPLFSIVYHPEGQLSGASQVVG